MLAEYRRVLDERGIDGFYNSRRRHSSIGYATPIEFERKAQIAALAAWKNCPSGRANFTPRRP